MSEPLERYREKRHFDRTEEPPGEAPQEPAGHRFVVQKHAARRLHYDVRLEVDGVLASWAVPKGPSYDPRTKRLAMHVEDHPLDYRTFEGRIPAGEYGGGAVIVWDEGVYRNITQHGGTPIPVRDAIERGHVSVWLEGTKLRGGWSLTRTGDGQTGRDAWIMVKRSDEQADPSLDIEVSAPDSVTTGRSLEAVGVAPREPVWTRAVATWKPPMLAEAQKPAAHQVNTGDDQWLYERKLDGLRCLAVRNGSTTELWSRNHLSFNRRFPEVASALTSLAADNFVLDGEIVAFDGDRTSFSQLQRPGATGVVVFCVFDIVHLLGQDTTVLPLADRKSLISRVLEGSGDLLREVPAVTGDPVELLARACAAGWEGLIAKRRGSTYVSGRSGDWRKLKCSASQELVIGGWTEPKGTREGFGSVLVGYYDDDGLQYAGKVGTGFDAKLLRTLSGELARREQPTTPFSGPIPLKGVHWTTPDLVANIAFSEWTRDGKLRHPSFEGLRPDKDGRTVRREDTDGPAPH